ncbi:MAG: branched-chain amino acid ABC transporter permease [Alphaproteobacteria bacterium]
MMGNRLVMALIACLVIAGVMPFVVDTYFLGVALDLLMWVALAESWILLSGMTGYISLGHAVFFGAGSYVMVLCWGVLPFWLVVPLAGLVAGLLALGVGYPCLRVRGPYFVILSFGVAEFVKFVVVSIEAGLGKAGRLLFGTPSLETLYFIMLVLAAASVVIAYRVRRSRFGAGLRAIREDEDAAETIGVPTTRFKLFAYGLSAIIPGMVGAVMVLRSTYFEPLQVFNPVVSFTIVSMAIIGGSDDAPGPLMGALFLVILSEILWANLPELYMILLGMLLVGFVLGAPNGIYGWLRARRVGTEI